MLGKQKLKLITLFLLNSSVVFAECYKLPANGDDVVGNDYQVKVKKGDNLTSLRMNNDVSYVELVDANPKINFHKLKVGQTITISRRVILPEYRTGIVVNVPESRMYYFTPDGKSVYTFPVGLGRDNWRTPVGIAKVVRKKENPTWTPPESIRRYTYNKTGKILPKQVPPGPDNPLGKYALYLDLAGNYHIHGTNMSTTVGAFVSSGCMRLGNNDIKFLYENVPINTPVRVVHFLYKAGWLANKLYLEVHRPIDDDDYGKIKNPDLGGGDVQNIIEKKLKERNEHKVKLDWSTIKQNVRYPSGIPQLIST